MNVDGLVEPQDELRGQDPRFQRHDRVAKLRVIQDAVGNVHDVVEDQVVGDGVHGLLRFWVEARPKIVDELGARFAVELLLLLLLLYEIGVLGKVFLDAGV